HVDSVVFLCHRARIGCTEPDAPARALAGAWRRHKEGVRLPRWRLWPLQSSSRDLGVLELQRLVVREARVPAPRGNRYAICDPQTGLQVGIAREEPVARWNFLSSFFNTTLSLKVCETEDESLVFTVHLITSWWRRRLEIYDAEDSLIGYGEQRNLSGRQSYWIYDRSGLPFVEVQEAPRGVGWISNPSYQDC